MDEIKFVEEYFGIKLLEYQKDIIRKNLKEGKPPYYIHCPRGCDTLSWIKYMCQKFYEKEIGIHK